MAADQRGFLANYTTRRLEGVPQDRGRTFYYPGAREVVPVGWIGDRDRTEAGKLGGVFAQGDLAPEGPVGQYACANPEEVVVVEHGDGYVVDARDPTRWSEVGVGQIPPWSCHWSGSSHVALGG